jgi:hypothetical protein
MPKSEQISVENVNVPGYTHIVDAAMYNAMLQALMQVLPNQSPGLTQAEMLAALTPTCPRSCSPAGPRPAGG